MSPQHSGGVRANGSLSVCFISIIRIIYLNFIVDFSDFTYGMTSIAIWGSIEVNIAIICACAATLKPLANKWWPNLMGSQTATTWSGGSSQAAALRTATARRGTRSEGDGKGGMFVRLHDLDNADGKSVASDDVERGLGSGRGPISAPASTYKAAGVGR